MYKLIAIDMDGTLLKEDKTITFKHYINNMDNKKS